MNTSSSSWMGHFWRDCCDICGDIGVALALITCTQCKISREHMYCMRTLLEEHIDDWRCEECVSRSKPKPPASSPVRESPGMSKSNKSVEVRNGDVQHAKSKQLPTESKKGSFNWEKKVARGKTKYISVKEAIMLSSGENKRFVPSNDTSHSKLPRPKIGVGKSDRLPVSPRTDLQQSKPERAGNIEVCKGQLRQSKKLTEVQRSASSLGPEDPANAHIQKEQPSEVKLPQPKLKSLLKKSSHASSPNALRVAISGGNATVAIEPRTCNIENVNNNLLPDLEKCQCTPSLDALWKGSFSIRGDHRHQEVNYRIQAHPPPQVRRKIYEFAKKIPEVLRFQVVPFKKFWISLFHEHIPGQRDIGLYFFPSDRERSEDYVSLLKYVSVQNLALRTQIADVELLVFSSKLLPLNCKRWKGNYFLWGVFHRLKRDTTGTLDNRLLESSVQPSHDANRADDSGDVDMDIDMIGGVNVGRIDVSVQRKPLKTKRVRFKEDPVINPVPRRDFDPTAQVRPLSVKTEAHDVIPPGFEDIYRERFKNSPKNVAVWEEKRRTR
ncbi:hypothetical protein CDL12_24377 [Handroanthus impetiginosus]|uniref:AIPP2-like SPOC-like domain-containing protein n=1 Tax=Handroanthus impetiginosus TaxID=429701 RepID=A0A2G9GCT1_9LAMI|nr:hypothetical protein CDL12_24377 [Handroanthus impetiginosus]